MSKEEKKTSNVPQTQPQAALGGESEQKEVVVSKPKLYRIYMACKTSPKFPQGKKLLTVTRAIDDSDALEIGRIMLAEQLSGKITVKLA